MTAAKKRTELDPRTLRHCKRKLIAMALGHRQSMRNLRDIPDGYCFHQHYADALETAANIFADEEREARRIEAKQKRARKGGR